MTKGGGTAVYKALHARVSVINSWFGLEELISMAEFVV
jgi:hypothetical protein